MKHCFHSHTEAHANGGVPLELSFRYLGIFRGSGAMFTEWVRVGCSLPVCCGGSAKYQTCLIFH